MKLIAIVIFLVNISIVNAMPEIHFHAKDGRVEKVKELLDNDPNLVNSRTKTGDTPLHWAIRTGRKVVVDVLLEYEANVTAVNNYGNTCLHVAAESGRPELVELMLRKGSDIHAKNKYGDTPLHEAARTHSNEVIRVLIKAGANIDAENNSGHTPMDKAMSSRRFYEKSLNQDNTRDDLKKGILLYDTTIRILSHAEENNAVEPPPSRPHLVSAESRLDLKKPGDYLIASLIKGDVIVHGEPSDSITRLYLSKTASVGDDLHALDNSQVFIFGATVNGDLTTRNNSRAFLYNTSLGQVRCYSKSYLLINKTSVEELQGYGNSQLTMSSGSIKKSIWMADTSQMKILGGSVTGRMRVGEKACVIIYGKDFNCGFGRIDEKKAKHITGTSLTGQKVDFDLDTAENGAVYLKPVPKKPENIQT